MCVHRWRLPGLKEWLLASAGTFLQAHCCDDFFWAGNLNGSNRLGAAADCAQIESSRDIESSRAAGARGCHVHSRRLLSLSALGLRNKEQADRRAPTSHGGVCLTPC